MFITKYCYFSNKYYNDICKLNNNKIYRYCFIGSISSSIYNRQWVLEFVKKHFDEKCVFINTDPHDTWDTLGVFDLSKKTVF